MKKACVLFVSVLLLLSCSTTRYTHYEYDRYFQNTEPYTYVDDPEDAARYIARKIARQFRRSEYRTIAVLNFTDEYGDPLNRGMYFADEVAFALSRYRNPVVVKRETLYEMVRERQLFHRDLIRERGYMASRLVHADYVLTGRIIRGEWDERVSVRCFETGTGRVVYAATLHVEYPGVHMIRHPGSRRPYHPFYRDRWGERPSRRDDDDTEDDEDQESVKKPSKKDDGIESVGKKDREKEKEPDPDKVRYKQKAEDKKSSGDNDNSGDDRKVKKKANEEEPEPSSSLKKKAGKKEKEEAEKGTVLKK